MADASFDVVSKVDRQEIDNALNQAAKELSQRFDFRGVNATIAWAGEEGVSLSADHESRASRPSASWSATAAWAAETDGAEVTVRCTRNVDIAFGWLFLGGRPLERTAVASARAPTLP